MKVNIEAQHACTDTLGGIPIYTVNLIQKLLERGKYEYQLTLFDKNKERGNRIFADKHFKQYNRPIFECNTESYGTLLRSENAFRHNSYNDYTSTYADVYHFPHVCAIPDRIHGEMVVTCHDLIPTVVPSFWEWVYTPVAKDQWDIAIKRLNEMKPFIIADSTATKRDICSLTQIPPERIFVVLLAHDNKTLYPDINAETLKMFEIDSPYLLIVTALHDQRKGVVDIITAFEKIAARYTDLKLVLTGAYQKDLFPALADKLQKSGVKDRIIMTGSVSDEQKRHLLSAASVFLFPSEYEGFGLPVLEAMACGAPVITADVSSLPEVGGGAAVYVEPKNPEQLAHEIGRLLDSDELRNGYIKKGLERSKKFSWDKTAQMTEDVYKFAYAQR